MTSLKLVLYLTCVVLVNIAQASAQKSSSSVRQEMHRSGERLTLQCGHKDDDTSRALWYKQTVGKELKLISSVYKYGTNDSFHGDFRKNPRFSLDHQNGKNHLTISDLQRSDSATYYCIICRYCVIEILETIQVSVKSSSLNIPAVVQHSESETNQPGGSVTLNCTVQTGNCDGEHSVYWFKNSDESQPGLLYTNEGRNEQCEREPDSQTHTCEYSLPVKNLNVSDAGTYYCAVVSCGHVLFGNGIKLDFKGGVDYPALVYFLSGALIFAAILIVFMAVCMYKMNKRNSFLSQEAQAIFSAASSRNLEDHREAENLFYAALSVNMSKTSRRQRNMVKEECVYSSVKQ